MGTIFKVFKMKTEWLLAFAYFLATISANTETESTANEVEYTIENEAEFELPVSMAKRDVEKLREYGAEVVSYSSCSAPGGYPGSCKPLVSCAQYYATQAHFSYEKSNYYKSCTYGYGSHGACCPDIYYSGPRKPVLTYNPKKYGYSTHDVASYSKITKDCIVKATKYAYEYMKKEYFDDKGLGRGEDDPSYWGNGIAPENYVKDPLNYGDTGFFLALVTEYLAKHCGYKPESVYDGGLKLIEYIEYFPESYAKVCRSYYKKCHNSIYRSIDGSCNNLKHPYYGQSNTILGRIAIPSYGDRIYSVRKSVDGYPLPSPRPIRYHALSDKDVSEKSVNMMSVYFGQFITHDVVHTPFYQATSGLFLDCCYGYKGGEEQVHPKCYAIPITSDPFYSKVTKEKCLNFARGIIAPNYGCAAGYANPLNYQTSHLDLSLQYGKNYNESHELRTHKNGLLVMSKVGDEYYLPLSKDAECFNSSQGFCFKSGDLRTTIHAGLTIQQIFSHRFHNVLAKYLKAMNPNWDDEKLYQEARRINIAVYQHIVYTEYLPQQLGWKFMYEHGILPPTKGYSYDYDENAKPWIYVEFSGAAFRHHTSVYGKIIFADEKYGVKREVPLQNYYNSAILFKNPKNMPELVRGYLMTPERKHDKYYDPAISNYLLKDERHFGLDIGTFNMQRGREYGIGSYNDYREICGLRRARTWADFLDYIDPEVVEQFKKMYKNVNDVDLYSGGLAERHFPDSYVGPTFWCIIGFQFQRLKMSDRYFYTHGHQKGSFTMAQLTSIRKMSFAAYICMTSPTVKEVPMFAFRTISKGNPLISCSDYEKLPQLDLKPWKASSYHHEL